MSTTWATSGCKTNPGAVDPTSGGLALQDRATAEREKEGKTFRYPRKRIGRGEKGDSFKGENFLVRISGSEGRGFRFRGDSGEKLDRKGGVIGMHFYQTDHFLSTYQNSTQILERKSSR